MLNMSILAFIGYIAGVIGFVATMAAAITVVKSSATKSTITNQKELIDTLLSGKEEQKEQIADLQNKHIESVKSVSALQGQVDVLRTIPLKEISSDMRSIADEMKTLANSQVEIISLIRSERKAAAK